MDGVVHSPHPHLFIVVVPWVLSSLSTAVAGGQIIRGTYWFSSCTHFCMSHSLLLSYHINETCPPSPKGSSASSPLAPDCLSCFWHVVWALKWKCGGNTQMFSLPRWTRARRQLEKVHVGIVLLLWISQRIPSRHRWWCLQSGVYSRGLSGLSTAISTNFQIRGGATNGRYVRGTFTFNLNALSWKCASVTSLCRYLLKQGGLRS